MADIYFFLQVQDTDRQRQKRGESVSHLASQLVNNSRGSRETSEACVPQSPWPALLCSAPGPASRPRPSLVLVPVPFPFPCRFSFSFSCAGCKSSTIALIYNFCLAMQNTWAALGSPHTPTPVENGGGWQLAGAWHCGASPSHVFGLAYKYFAVCLPWCA